MSNIISIEKYQPKPDDKFFLDANIWIYLFCPLGNAQLDKIKKYDGFLKKIIESKAKIFVSSLLLSEFFNTYLRLEFNISKNTYKNFKEYKKTECYKAALSDIKETVKKRILKISFKINDDFENIDFDIILKEFEQMDFNDSYYTNLAYKSGLKIVTDDFDLSRAKINIPPLITANQKILKAGRD